MSLRGFLVVLQFYSIYIKLGNVLYKQRKYILTKAVAARLFLGRTIGVDSTAITTIYAWFKIFKPITIYRFCALLSRSDKKICEVYEK